MTILPGQDETIILAQSKEEVIAKLVNATTPRILVQNQESPHYKFTGWVHKEKFRISLKINRPNNYVPLIIGRVDSSSSGSLLFIHYRLFPSTKMFLMFWSLFVLFAGILLSYQYKTPTHSFLAIILLGFIHWVVWSNFKIQLKITRQSLLDVLS